MGQEQPQVPPPLPSTEKKFLLLGISSLHVLLASGEVFGWTALLPVLYNTGYFSMFDVTTQAQSLTVVCTLGVSANALIKLPLGIFLDRYGPRWTSAVGGAMVVVGSLMMAWCDVNSLWYQGTGFFLLGASGPFIQMSCFNFSNLMPSIRQSIISFMVCLFEISTGVFYGFYLANQMIGLGREVLFSIYAGVGVFVCVTALVFWPDHPYEALPEDPVADSELGTTGKGDDKGQQGDHKQSKQQLGVIETTSGPLHMHDRSLARQMMSWEFTYLLLFFTVHNFTQGIVVTTMGLQIEYFFQDERTADFLVQVFSIVLPLGFLPMLVLTFTGVSGVILSRPQLSFVWTTLLCCLYAALFLVPEIWAYVLLAFDFSLARQFWFGTFIAYTAETFGYGTFGTITGLISSVAGVLQLGQGPVVALVVDPYTNYGWEELDITMALVPLLLIIPPLIVWCRQLVQRCCGSGKEDGSDGSVAAESAAACRSSHSPVLSPRELYSPRRMGSVPMSSYSTSVALSRGSSVDGGTPRHVPSGSHKPT